MIGVVDVETTMIKDGEEPRTKFWGLALEGRPYRRFKTTRALWRYLASQTDELLLYCHHDFDLIQVFMDGMPLEIQNVRGGKILRARGPSNVEWRNSYALFPSKLKEILEAAGFKKPELSDLEARNKADTVDALEAFRLLADKYEACWGVYPLGGSHLTASSVAFAAAQQAAGKLPVWTKDRLAYRGGRTEAFRLGACGDADLWDINSSYPASILEAPERDKLHYLDVEVETDGACPFFQLTDSRHKLLFPRGRFTTAIFQSVYDRYVKPHGAIRSAKALKTVAVDLSWLRRLAELVQTAYGTRQAAKARGDKVMSYAAKIGLNSIYGRLALKAERELAVVSETVPDSDHENGTSYFDMGDGRFLSFVTRPGRRLVANYLYAAFITDNARGRLYDALAKTGHRAFYCDTDSLYLPKGTSMEGLALGDQLGAWKFEGTKRLSITGLKDYRYGNDWKRKGGRESFTWTFKHALKGEGAKLVKRHRRTSYDKRVVDEKTGLTTPVVVG